MQPEVGTGMSTGKRVLTGIAMFIAIISIGCQATTQPQGTYDAPVAAWWYDIGFEPAGGSVHGIDAARFDPAWNRVGALEPQVLESRISTDDLVQFRDSGLSFSLQADLDGDRVPEEVFVGVFSTLDGNGGRFVAVSRNGRLLQHFTQNGPTGFSALLKNGDEVRWYKCMECGEFDSIRWSGRSYVLE